MPKTRKPARRGGGSLRVADPVVAMDAALLKRRPAAAAAGGEKPLAIDNESQLFADDHLVARMESLYRRLNQPEKAPEPFLRPDRPWEGQGLCYGSLLEHEGEWRLYYKGMNSAASEDIAAEHRAGRAGPWPICLAVSRDALRFAKKPVPGSPVKGANIVIDDNIDDFNMARDPFETDPAKRFKLLASRGNWWAGLTPATSPDGIRWTWGEENAVTFFGDRMSYSIDPVRRKHVAWSRNYQILAGRVIAHKETADFGDWADPRASHPKLVLQPDRLDHPEAWFYGGYPFWYRSLYFAYLEVYHIHLQRIDTQLCCSRDGLSWTRLCHRETFLPNGPHGSFDAYWIVPTFNPPVRRDGKLLIHYGGRPDPHGQPGFTFVPPGMSGAFGLATLREDGFVSLDATGTEGVLETKLLQLPAKRERLEVNVAPFHAGRERLPLQGSVEFLDRGGKSLGGCPLRPGADAVWLRVRPPRPLPAEVRLRFRLRNARLYSFRMQ